MSGLFKKKKEDKFPGYAVFEIYNMRENLDFYLSEFEDKIKIIDYGVFKSLFKKFYYFVVTDSAREHVYRKIDQINTYHKDFVQVKDVGDLNARHKILSKLTL